MNKSKIDDIISECKRYQYESMEVWKQITLTHIDREFATKVRAICNDVKEKIKKNYTIVCEQLQYVREHTEIEPAVRREWIEYYDMLLNVYGSMHTSFQMYCELADRAQTLPVKDVIEQMEQIRQRVRNKLNTIKKYVESLREGD